MDDSPKLHWAMSALWLTSALFMMFMGCFMLWAAFFSPAINANPPDKAREGKIVCFILWAVFTWKGWRQFRYWKATKA
jgi:hypothetical protein